MSYGDDEHPISVVFEPRMEGVHVKVVVRSGLRGMRGYAGELTFRPEDWAVMREALGISREVDTKVAVTLRYTPAGIDPASSWLHATKIVHLDLDPIEISPQGEVLDAEVVR